MRRDHRSSIWSFLWAILILSVSTLPRGAWAEDGQAAPAPLDSLLAECRRAADKVDVSTWLRTGKEAVRVAESQLTASHPSRRAAHRLLGDAYLAVRDYPLALEQYEEILDGGLAENSLERMGAVAGLSLAQIRRGQFGIAQRQLRSVLERLESAPVGTAESALLARTIGYLARYHLSIGNDDSALADVERALGLSQKVPHPDTLGLGSLYELLTAVHLSQANLQAAESVATMSFDMMTAKLGKRHILLAPQYEILGAVRQNLRHLEEARSLMETSADLTDSAFGYKHVSRLDVLKFLSSLHWTRGDYAKADSVIHLGMAIARENYGDLHPSMPTFLSNLGITYWALGDSPRAETCFEDGIRISKVVGLEGANEYAYSVNNLAVVCRRLGKMERAEQLFKESLALREKRFGPNHPNVAAAIQNLANLYIHTDHTDRVEPLMLRAIAIWDAAFGPDDLEAAPAVYNLAVFYFSQGQYEKSQQFYHRALRIWTADLGSKHPFIGKALSGLARVFACTDKPDSSSVYYAKLLSLRQDFVKYAFSFSSDGAKLKVLGEHPVIDHSLIDLAVTSKHPLLTTQALEMVLRGKAIALEAMRTNRRIGYCESDAAVTDQLTTYRSVCDSLSTIALAKTAARAASISLERLYHKQDSLETYIARQCAGFRRDLQWQSVTSAAVAASLPDSTALWEFIRYSGYDFAGRGTDEKRLREPRYAAFILSQNAAPKLIDLGKSEEIDSLIDAARSHITGSTSLVMSPLGGETERLWFDVGGRLAARVLAPLLAKTPKDYAIVISPDYKLALLPFEILPTSDSTYLIESRRIAYLTSGRDLLSSDHDEAAQGTACILADPAFTVVESSFASANGSQVQARGAGNSTAPCPGNFWPPLPQTRQEAQIIADLLTTAFKTSPIVLTGERATEAHLKHLVQPPLVLHLATHGFYCPSATADSAMAANPLLRSGLVLAEASRQSTADTATRAQADDGFLTALEVSALNLAGTRLVSLSACESGTGDAIDAEGVAGLRYAFRMAGAKALVMSLWDVDDGTAKDLVSEFYRHWLNGEAGSVAMRQAQLSLLQRARQSRGCGHPRLWGGFILEGDEHR